MPLVEITAPAGSLSDAAVGTLQREVAKSVLRWMGLPDTDFFSGATWVYVQESRKGWSGTGSAQVQPGFLVVVTPLAEFLTPERNESLSVELTQIFQDAAGLSEEEPPTVWVLINEIPEGYWSVNGGLTRRAKIDELIAQQD
jgi:phenylpyruvate tautomerase PptA (4-oxalocrotonate tautomerase family)